MADIATNHISQKAKLQSTYKRCVVQHGEICEILCTRLI